MMVIINSISVLIFLVLSFVYIIRGNTDVAIVHLLLANFSMLLLVNSLNEKRFEERQNMYIDISAVLDKETSEGKTDEK